MDNNEHEKFMSSQKLELDREALKQKTMGEQEVKDEAEAGRLTKELKESFASVAQSLESLAQGMQQLAQGQQQIVAELQKPKQVRVGGVQKVNGQISGATVTVQ
jgi:hypothetical protein